MIKPTIVDLVNTILESPRTKEAGKYERAKPRKNVEKINNIAVYVFRHEFRRNLRCLLELEQ